MAHTKTLTLALCLATSVACTTVQLKMRKPGEKLVSFPEPVAREYHCDKRPLPFFEVEESQLLPKRVGPGSEFNHRMVYVLCPDQPTAVVKGKITSQILYRGAPIFSEVIQGELRPGRWMVDTFIPLPADAQPGIYSLHVTFSSAQGKFETQDTFSVEGL